MVDERALRQVDERALRQKPFWFIEKDGGFTNAGVVIAVALTLALLFTSAQVYWVNSKSGEIQFAADAGALAAENVVAEYYVIVRVADAVVLSMSLFGLAVYGVAIVASCIPFAQEVGPALMNFGTKVFNARDSLAKQSQETLVALQKVLPFLAAVNASSVISANSFSPTGETCYQGFAILVPLTGDDIGFFDDNEAQNSQAALEEHNEKTSAASYEAESARKAMEQAKYEGYMADCGAACEGFPDDIPTDDLKDEKKRCMYERAINLAGLIGARNPRFNSVELWEFDYALARAKEYYKMRLTTEAPLNSSLEEQIRSYARSLYYAYALEELQKGYVIHDADGGFDAYFPALASHDAETRKTRLYTDRSFPVDTKGYIHAIDTCPELSGNYLTMGSVSDLEKGVYEKCPVCNLSIATISRVASPTSFNSSGFEYHYRIVADAAERYKKASREYKDLTEEAKESATEAFDTFAKALESLKSPRINISPPGRNGCIVIAFDLSSHSIPSLFSSPFVSNNTSLPPRMAISAAALVEDEASGGNTILSSFFDRLSPQLNDGSSGLSFLGVFDKALGIWGDLLLVYSEGIDSMVKGLGDFLRAIPIINKTPLASWAEKTLRETIELFGLQGADLSAPKPVIVNSIHVINASDSRALALLGQAKQTHSTYFGSASGTITEGFIDALIIEFEQRGSSFLESEFTIYTISFGDAPGLPQIPIRMKLPPTVVEKGKSLFSDGLDRLRMILGGGSNGSVWE